jgi:cation diffusion facilitator family transporter
LILLSLAAALATITLKTIAWRMTGSVGLFSDAVESVVNFVAAAGALVAIRWATLPPDEDHMYGHEKAEYFAAAAEGLMIIGAAASIAWVAVDRLRHPAGIEDVGVGLTVSAAASLVNLGVGITLIGFGRRYRSIALEADGKHLMTDVWTSMGVIVGVFAVALTGWRVLDPAVALAVAANIVLTGISLIRRTPPAHPREVATMRSRMLIRPRRGYRRVDVASRALPVMDAHLRTAAGTASAPPARARIRRHRGMSGRRRALGA